jgi:hypothetical protein
MITLTTVDATHGTRLPIGYVAPPAQSGGKRMWRQFPLADLGGFVVDNSTGVSEVEYRRR